MRMNQLEFQRRREQLMAIIGPESVAVIFGADEVLRNADTHFRFRQNSDFFYLTGFTEPNAILVLTPGREEGEVTLFLNPRDPAIEQWVGRRLGPEQASDQLGVDVAIDINEVDKKLPTLFVDRHSLHTLWTAQSRFDERVHKWLHQLKKQRKSAPEQIMNLSLSLHELRLKKSKLEQQTMRRAAEITAQAHIRAMKSCKPGLYEWELDAEIQSEFLAHGAHAPAYPSIVASGENACIMHYVENSAQLTDGALVLIDAGCEFEHYAADVTRTFPVSGMFSQEQRALYEVVLAAQKAAIAVARPGNCFKDPHEASQRKLVEGLIDLGIIKEDLDTVIEKHLDRKFLVHGCSHWLGLDVHDVGAARHKGKSRVLEDGMVLTIEPGAYIPSDDTMKEVDVTWHGIGIRIEDDVLITADGNEVLTSGAPKHPDEIELLMHG
ncbi:MAG: Xaa-Pro aminopeptidase [Gammaproteobacteria bacterium]|nr:Xaa-Pro aminopeptidase [Gammaproteobacteria bacterium]